MYNFKHILMSILTQVLKAHAITAAAGLASLTAYRQVVPREYVVHVLHPFTNDTYVGYIYDKYPFRTMTTNRMIGILSEQYDIPEKSVVITKILKL